MVTLLGYPLTQASFTEVDRALAAIRGLPPQLDLSTVNEEESVQNAIDRIETWLNQLVAILDAINTQRNTEGSSLLPELRREGRRYTVLIANALDLEVRMDIFGSSGT